MKSSTLSTKTSYSSMNGPEQSQDPLDADSNQAMSVFVGGLPPRCTQDQLTQFMSQFGYVKEVYISKHRKYPGHKGFGFVNFSHVTDPTLLFGKHSWKGQLTEVKRSLQNYLQLHDIPPQVTRADILSVFSQKGFQVWEILMGGIDAGIPQGVAGVRLSQYCHQEQVSMMGYIEILNQPVRVALHIPKNQYMPPKPLSIQNSPGQPRPRRFNSQTSDEHQSFPRITTSSEDLLSAHTSGNGAQTEGGNIRSSISGLSRDSADHEPHSKIESGSSFDHHQPRYDQPVGLRANPVPVMVTSGPSQPLPVGLGMNPATGWRTPRPFTARREVFITFYAFPGHL